ncbi:MAG: 30S ribosomal protein S18 [bacterium]|nr:30S ribosomal protein S18 [bacterium]
MECILCKRNIKNVDFRDTPSLKHYISGLGKIRPKTKTGLCSTHQRKVATAVKRARHIGLMSPTSKQV